MAQIKLTEDRIAFLVDIAFRYGPDAARAAKTLFTKPDPTDEDWENVFSHAKKSYDQYVADARAELGTE